MNGTASTTTATRTAPGCPRRVENKAADSRPIAPAQMIKPPGPMVRTKGIEIEAADARTEQIVEVEALDAIAVSGEHGDQHVTRQEERRHQAQ